MPDTAQNIDFSLSDKSNVVYGIHLNLIIIILGPYILLTYSSTLRSQTEGTIVRGEFTSKYPILHAL